VRALVEHLGIARADVIGYSMGARICGYLAAHEPAVRSAVLAGVGLSLVRGRSMSETIAAALEAPSLADVTDPTGRMFRTFAEQTRSDLRALGACIRGSGERLSPEDAAAIRVPVLVAAGTADDVAGPVRPLADMIPGARVLEIPGRDHMRSVGDRVFKDGTLAFLAART
jgi:pimeloyl-ACP methyl ester carboxylesterase